MAVVVAFVVLTGLVELVVLVVGDGGSVGDYAAVVNSVDIIVL